MEFLGIEFETDRTVSVLWCQIEREGGGYWEYLQGDNIATDLITAHLQRGGREGDTTRDLMSPNPSSGLPLNYRRVRV